MTEFEQLGYTSEDELLEDLLGCNSEYSLEDFFNSYDPN